MSSKARRPYFATLTRFDNAGQTYCETVVQASNDDEAMVQLEPWARAECARHGVEKAWLLVKDGAGTKPRTKLIDLTAI